MQIDPKTGLPQLPEGWLWRVQRQPGTATLWELWLVEKTRRDYVYRVTSSPEPMSALTPETVSELAEILWRKVFVGNPQLLGDYPPKVLGEA